LQFARRRSPPIGGERCSRIVSTTCVVHPEAMQCGTRWFVVSDPDGNLIAYEQPESIQ
jgi:hypothetical protein